MNILTNLHKEIVFTFKWYKKLTKRFLDLAFLQTVVVVIMTLFSQLFMLLSSMMPLKVIMLLGSTKVPNYFPISWQNISRDSLVIYLAFASVIFFIFYMISEKVINIYSKKGSYKVLENNKKVVLFEKQDVFAQNSYTKLSKSLSNSIFFILSLFALGILYPLIAVVIVLFIAICYIVFNKMYQNTLFLKKLQEELNPVLDLVKGIGFFIVFVFILASFIGGFYPPHIIVVIVSILLIRQMFSKLSEAVKDIVYLEKNRLKVNSLFFFSHTKIDISHDKDDPFWNMIKKENRKTWIKKIIESIAHEKIAIVDIQWYQVNLRNIGFFKVIVTDEQTNKTNTYLLKLFNKNISSQAIHEATILEELKKDSFGLHFIGSSVVDDFHCNIFEFDDILASSQKFFNAKHLTIRVDMMAIALPKELVDRYSRSHPYLYKRLTSQIFKKFDLVFDATELSTIKKLEINFDKIISKIEKLPLQFINPTITKYTLVSNSTNLYLLHFGSWKIDSLGAEYPIGINHIEILKKEFQTLQNTNEHLAEVNINDVVLSSLMCHFEKLCNGENFSPIIELIPRILEYTENGK